MVSAEFIKNCASEEGFNLCGIARCRQMSDHKVFFDSWLSSGYHSGLLYMTRYRDIRFDPLELLGGTKSVVVCAVNYKNSSIFEQAESDNPKVASYALCTDYHITIKRMLHRMVDRLTERYPLLNARVCCDTAPIIEKAWAVEAGMGWIGRHSLLITPEYGSLVLLGEILIDTPVDTYDEPYKANHCGECRSCAEACPGGAIVADKVIDTHRCISRLTIEENAPQQSDISLNGWIFGCDLCLRSCPYNRSTPLADNPDFTPLFDPCTLSREFWLSLDRPKFKQMFGKTPLCRRGLEEIQKILL